jgi:hypothetical protein
MYLNYNIPFRRYQLSLEYGMLLVEQ